MKTAIVIMFGLCFCGMTQSAMALELDLQDTSSAALVNQAWKALEREDYAIAVAYAEECYERYQRQAEFMQRKLQDFPVGANEDIHKYFALNDVATALYIKAESLRRTEQNDAAMKAYAELVNDYGFGQCWDPRGWFWKPAVVAQEKLSMLRDGIFYDFGDQSSMNLMVLAWKALDEGDFAAVMVYTKKCIDLYTEQARQMQKVLNDFPSGDTDQIHAYWALNDVATAYFIQGEAYFREGKMQQARTPYQRVIDDFSYAQCWDPRGWFWQVAKGSEEKLEMIESGMLMDFWDYTSAALVGKAWKALDSGDLLRALGYADKCIVLYTPQATAMQAELSDYPSGSEEAIHAYWALNDVSTAHYIKGRVYLEQKRYPQARREFRAVINDYRFGQCWDPNGWWWRPAHEAENLLKTISAPEEGRSKY